MHSWSSSHGGLENDPTRDSPADFQPCHLPVLDRVNSAHKTAKLAAKLEVAQLDFKPRTLVLVELHINQQHGRGVEGWLSIRYSQRLDVAVIYCLAETHQGLSWFREF